MSKYEIRTPLLLTAALALTPALAFAEGDPPRHDGTTTTTTTSPSDSSSASGSTSPPAASPEAPPSIDLNRQGVAPPREPSIDPGQVQRVFGMDVSLIDLKSLDSEQIKQLQQRLSERGFYRGKVDGLMGPQTKSALSALMAQQYSLTQRLINQGQITEQLASSIGVDTTGRVPVSGVDSEPQGQAQPSQAQPSQAQPSPAQPSPAQPSQQGANGTQGSPSQGSAPQGSPSQAPQGSPSQGSQGSPSQGSQGSPSVPPNL